MSALIIPTITKDRKKIIQKYKNIPIAVIYFDVVTIDGENKVCKKIKAFYDRLFERFFGWINEDFEKYAKKCYEEDTHPRKRYRYFPIELKCVMNYELAEERFLIVETVITLLKGNNEMSEKRLKHIWNLQRGNLHTQKRFSNVNTKRFSKMRN